MNTPADMRALVAVDLGAQSCRVSLLRWLADGPDIQVVHRVANSPAIRDGGLRWDLSAICQAADDGVCQCAAIAPEGIAAIGVTGWAVDYVRLGADGTPIADPFCYRDGRNAIAMEALHHRISPERLYEITGIQVITINTLYQLYADNLSGIPAHLRWLNLPEYVLHRWGGRPVAEHTNATHTAMVRLGRMQWSEEIFAAAGLDRSAAPEIVAPGTFVGYLQGPLAALPALRNTLLIAPACHDTASAVAGIPAYGDDWAFLSSGTWSLVGTLLHQPCASQEAARFNFTNEGAVGGNICFLRNVNGLWLLQQCIAAWNAAGERWSMEALVAAAESVPSPRYLLNVDDPDLLHPDRMPQRIIAALQREHGGVLSSLTDTPPAIARLVLQSLAARYAAVLREAELLTAHKFRRMFVVGGGSKNRLLNTLTQQATGLEIVRGDAESSTLGNFAVQLAALNNAESKTAGVQHKDGLHWAAVLSRRPGNSTSGASVAPPQAVPHMPTKSLRSIDHDG